MKKILSILIVIVAIANMSLTAHAVTTADLTSVQTFIEENGIIHTQFIYEDGYESNVYYGPDIKDAYRTENHINTYMLIVSDVDTLYFETEFEAKLSDVYRTILLDDGDYAICKNDTGYVGDYAYNNGSGLTYEAANEMVSDVLALNSIKSVEIQRGYTRYGWSSFSMKNQFTVYSNDELSREDFKWSEDMGYTIDILENNNGFYVVEAINNEIESWQSIYTFMMNCMDMPSVYAVNNKYNGNALMPYLSYETVEVIDETLIICDIDQNGTVEITDATAILESYANAAAGVAAASEENPMDVNGDGTVGIDDASFVLGVYAELAAGLR